MQTITATDLARNTRKILDTVAGQGETVRVERNHVTIAQIMPPELSMSASQALAGFEPRLSSTQASGWLKDSRNGFGEEVNDPWA